MWIESWRSRGVIGRLVESATFADCTFQTKRRLEEAIGAMDITSMGRRRGALCDGNADFADAVRVPGERGIAGVTHMSAPSSPRKRVVTSVTCGITNCLFVGNELRAEARRLPRLASGALSITNNATEDGGDRELTRLPTYRQRDHG